MKTGDELLHVINSGRANRKRRPSRFTTAELLVIGERARDVAAFAKVLQCASSAPEVRHGVMVVAAELLLLTESFGGRLSFAKADEPSTRVECALERIRKSGTAIGLSIGENPAFEFKGRHAHVADDDLASFVDSIHSSCVDDLAAAADELLSTVGTQKGTQKKNSGSRAKRRKPWTEHFECYFLSERGMGVSDRQIARNFYEIHNPPVKFESVLKHVTRIKKTLKERSGGGET
jgi:hypothetical protein